MERRHGCAARGIHYYNLAQSYVLTAGTAETLHLPVTLMPLKSKKWARRLAMIARLLPPLIAWYTGTVSVSRYRASGKSEANVPTNVEVLLPIALLSGVPADWLRLAQHLCLHGNMPGAWTYNSPGPRNMFPTRVAVAGQDTGVEHQPLPKPCSRRNHHSRPLLQASYGKMGHRTSTGPVRRNARL